MASKLCLALLFSIINSTIKANLEVPEISNEQDLSQLLKLLQRQAVFDTGNQFTGKHHKLDDGDLNIQTLNFIMKRNDTEEENGINQEIADRICKKTGRCGCTKGRCGKTRTVDSLEQNDDVNDLIQELKKLLERGKKDDPTRCENDHCGHDGNYRDNVKSEFEVDLKEKLERYGKKYKINEDIDAIILNIDDVMKPSNAPKKLDSSIKFSLDSFIDKHQDDLENLAMKDDLEGVILDLERTKDGLLEKNLDKTTYKNYKDLLDLNNLIKYASPKKTVSVSPEDLMEYYEVFKDDLTKKLLRYLKDPTANKQHVVRLPNKQQSLLDKLKLRVIRGENLNDSQLKRLILQIIFGDQSHMKVLQHEEENDNIYLPTWLQQVIVESLSQNYLHTNRRLLPLTRQQKTKLQKKNQRNTWRRESGSGPNSEQFGVPFELNLQGLGQAVL